MACSRDESGIKEGEKGEFLCYIYILKRGVEREFIRRSNFRNFWHKCARVAFERNFGERVVFFGIIYSLILKDKF